LWQQGLALLLLGLLMRLPLLPLHPLLHCPAHSLLLSGRQDSSYWLLLQACLPQLLLLHGLPYPS
jgi:hypothetical protein